MRRLLQTLTTGYMLMFFSENVFWSRYRPAEDSLSNYVMTCLAYSLVAYILLALVRIYRIRSLWAVFLAGAACGWLAEGVIVQTAYEQFPLQLSWTGLAWHALISVVWGWYFLRKLLLQGSTRQVLLHSALFGLFAGAWAISWWLETPGSQTPPLAYAVYACVTSGLFILSCWIFQRLSDEPFNPGKRTLAVVSGFFGLVFLAVVVVSIRWAILVLPPLFALIVWGLRRNRQAETRPDLLEALAGSPPAANYLALLAMPAAAAGFYTLASLLNWQVHTNQIVYLVTTPAGALLFVISLFRVSTRPAQAQPHRSS